MIGTCLIIQYLPYEKFSKLHKAGSSLVSRTFTHLFIAWKENGMQDDKLKLKNLEENLNNNCCWLRQICFIENFFKQDE